MDDLSVPKQPRLRFWRWLYHPLVLISVAVHGLLLAAPVPSALDPEKPAVEEPLPEPEEEIIPVDILNLAPPPAAPPPSATPAQAPQPSSGPPVPPSAEELEKLQETLTDEERQDLQNDPPPGNNDPDPGQNQGGGPPPPPNFDTAGQGRFFGSLNQQDYGNFDQTENWSSLYSGLIDRYLPDAAQKSLFFGSDREPVSQVSNFKYITRNVDLVAQEDLQPTAEAAGLVFDPSQFELYGGQRLYTLNNANGVPAAYVSLVDLRGGTVVLVWDSDPRQ